MEPAMSLDEVFSEDEEFPVPQEGEELEEEEEESDGEEGAQIFSAWMSRYNRRQGAVGGASFEEDSLAEASVGGATGGEKEEEQKTELHVSSCSTSFPPARRRSSLPCPSTLSAMQLNRLQSLAQAPVSARVLLLRRDSARSLSTNQEEDPATPKSVASANQQRRRSLVPPTLPEVTEESSAPKRTTTFRRRNVMSLSDADSTCLICHDDLQKAGKQIRELECAHSFHNECIDEWLFRKRACPTCRVPAVSHSVHWGATRVKVP